MFVEAATASTSVSGAIRQASRITGANFHYLLAAAKVESNLNPNASARTSSAGGLFQFIDQTWLGTLKQSGAALGYGRFAEAIEQTDSGRYVVSDSSLRGEIMKLRQDPTANAVMAGAFTNSNAAYLTQSLGREPTEGELYIAHFLGARGAAKLIGLAAATPNALAKESFPRAAASNRTIFFGEQGRPRSFSEVTRVLAARYDVARASQGGTATAQAAPALPPSAIEAARIARAYEAASPSPSPSPSRPAGEDTDFNFRNPYRATGRANVAPEVAAPAPAPPPARILDRVAAAQPPSSGETLGLFQDMAPNVRALFTGG